MKESLIRSQMDLYGRNRKLDVALLHAPFCWQGHCTPQQEAYSWLHAWKNLENLHNQGYVSAIGASNLNPHQLRELLNSANSRVSVIQNWMDPFRQDKEVRSICKQYGIVYMAYSSLGGQWSYISSVGYNPVLTHPTLQSIAEKHNTTISTVVLTWVLHEGAVIIPRSANKENIKTNAELLIKKISLDEYDVRLIEGLDGTLGEY
jgi:diketogulonate reductase-like aldo/keto reductase